MTSAHAVSFFDKLAFRAERRLSRTEISVLSANSLSVNQRKGRPIRASKADWLVTLVKPNGAALAFIAQRDDLICNYCEVAIDLLVENEVVAARLGDLFDRHFVQRWHGRGDFVAEKNGTYTRRNKPGVRLVWYWDRPSKETGNPCLHVEVRAHGMRAVRSLGINEAADLQSIDFGNFWQKHLHLYEIDFDRLGRFHENRRLGQRRRKPNIQRSGRFRYYPDSRLGNLLFRAYGETAAFAKFCRMVDRSDPEFEQRPEKRLIDRNVQTFINTYGRGSFLKPLAFVILQDWCSDIVISGGFFRTS